MAGRGRLAGRAESAWADGGRREDENVWRLDLIWAVEDAWKFGHDGLKRAKAWLSVNIANGMERRTAAWVQSQDLNIGYLSQVP